MYQFSVVIVHGNGHINAVFSENCMEGAASEQGLKEISIKVDYF